LGGNLGIKIPDRVEDLRSAVRGCNGEKQVGLTALCPEVVQAGSSVLKADRASQGG
jgi:hypothetical protein